MKIFLIILFSFAALSIQSQVREVKQRATEYSSGSATSDSRSYSYESTSEDGDFFLVQLVGELMFGSIINGFSTAQFYQLNNSNSEDWRISFEAGLNGGINFSQVEFFDSQTIRGNYGLFSMQLRRFNVNDVSGSFTTLDWQLLQLNLINREKVRWVVGLGISQETQINQTHLEWVTEFSFSMLAAKWMPQFAFRQSGDGYPRTEFSAILDYRPFRNRRNEFSFNAGYVYQDLYDIPFHFPSIGVGFWIK